MMKKILISAGAIAIVLLLLFFTVLPRMVDTFINGIHGKSIYHPSLKALSLVKKIFIADLHCDALMWNRNLLVKYSRGHVDVPRLIEGNVGLETFAVVSKVPAGMNNYRNPSDSDILPALEIAQLWPPRTWFGLKERALYQSEKLHNFSRLSDGKLYIIESAEDLDRYLELRKKNPSITAGLLAIEGTQVLEGDLNNIDVLYRAGFRMISPTHFFDTDISGSAHGIDKGGLTPKGREWVRIMERKNMIIDLAHASPKAIDEILSIATRPVVVSHTGVKGVCDNIRNISDGHIDGVARTGGIVGISYFPVTICGKEIEQIARSIRYTVNRAGIKHVGLGSDYDGAVSVPFDTTGMALLADALLKEGFTDEEIGLIMGGNVLRLLKEVLPKK
jgi:membrane dipeptidase